MKDKTTAESASSRDARIAGPGQSEQDLTQSGKGLKVSVLIPVRNEEASIRQLLDSLLNQTLKPAEIVITDGGSTDATPAIISEYAGRGTTIRLIRESVALPGRGRNLAAAQAANDWIAFIDAGIRPEPTWLQLLAERAKVEIDVDVVYGSYEPVSDTLFKRCAVMAYVSPPVEIEGKFVRSRFVASMLMKRSVWQAVGGFPEDLRSAEDLLFMNKVERAGFRIVRAPDAMVHWQVQSTPRLTFKRFMTYARSNMRAGLWRQWQLAIFKRYGLLLVLVLPAIKFGANWLLVPLLLWVSMLVGRAAVAIWRNRRCYPGSIFENIARMVVLVPLIAMLDAATIIGTLQWLATDRSYFQNGRMHAGEQEH
ncbi:MAG: glycosyltransferase [Pyrinomonadaceae bacterium]